MPSLDLSRLRFLTDNWLIEKVSHFVPGYATKFTNCRVTGDSKTISYCLLFSCLLIHLWEWIFFFWIYLWMKVYACCKVFIFSEVAARNALQKQGPENVGNIMSGRKNPSKIHVKRLIFSRALPGKDFLHRLFSKDVLQELYFHWLLLHFHSKTHLSWT